MKKVLQPWGIPRKWLLPDMSEKMFNGMLKCNQILLHNIAVEQQYPIHYTDV